MPDTCPASRTALVFLPGLPFGPLDQSTDGLSRRLCHALNLRALQRQPTFELGPLRVQSYGDSWRAEVQPILRREGDEHVSAVLDVVVLPYFPALTRGFARLSTGRKMLRLLASMLAGLPRIGRALLSVQRRKALPIIAAGGVFALLGAYFLLLAATVVVTLLSALPSFAEKLDLPELAQLHLGRVVPGWLLAHAATLLASMTALQALVSHWVPDAKRAVFTDLATACLGMIEYLNGAAERTEVTHHLQSFLERLHDDDAGYGEVHVIGYSFGALVALDSLFPVGAGAYTPPPVMRTVKSLSTIGCPFDAVSAFWPDHFRERVALADAPESWINISIRNDPLGSTFREAGIRAAGKGGRRPDDQVEGAEWGQVTATGWGALLFQFGQLRFHAQYWYDSVQTRDCFDPLVTRLLARHPVLVGGTPAAQAATACRSPFDASPAPALAGSSLHSRVA